ncbi:MAG: MATE family efflux transporter [Treponema sp.]|nr:MATE family efflux transporter [Treponema sp.]
MKLKGFYSSLIAIAVPVMMQNLLQTFVNMLDTIMIGRLGSIEIAAVGLGNQVFFVLNMILFGITSGGGVFIAQFWGKKEIAGIKKSLGIMLTLSIIVSAVFTVLCLTIPHQILRLYSPDPEVIRVGGDYLRLVSLSYIATAIIFAYTQAFRGTERVKLPLVCTSLSLVTNALTNYILIFVVGWGVKGAALATVFSRAIELVIILAWSYGKKYEACGSLKDLMDFDWTFIGKFVKIALPVIFNETMWGLGITVTNAIYAHAGTDAITAVNITGTISQLTWVFCMGFGNGMSVIIGKKIGEGETELAQGYAKRSLWFMPAVGAAVGIFLWPLSYLLPVFFNVSPEIIKTAKSMLIVLMICYPFNSSCMNWVVGVCRAGGDTVFSALAEMGTMWGYAVPIGFLATFVFNLPIVWIYICISSENVLKAIVGLIRVLSGKWLHDVTR